LAHRNGLRGENAAGGFYRHGISPLGARFADFLLIDGSNEAMQMQLAYEIMQHKTTM
jgi:hypothetical protein